jgi:hypothetical protein
MTVLFSTDLEHPEADAQLARHLRTGRPYAREAFCAVVSLWIVAIAIAIYQPVASYWNVVHDTGYNSIYIIGILYSILIIQLKNSWDGWDSNPGPKP